MLVDSSLGVACGKKSKKENKRRLKKTMPIPNAANRQLPAPRVEVLKDLTPQGGNEDRRLLTTMTKEIYMLARLHYDLLD